jgi:hypothetical protein
VARRLATILLATRLSEVQETTRSPRGAGCAGGRTTLVKMRSYYLGICHPTAIHRGDGGEADAI